MASPEPITFQQIRDRAYDLWERNHRPEGMEMQFWLLAERELRTERDRRKAGTNEAHARQPGAQSERVAEPDAEPEPSAS